MFNRLKIDPLYSLGRHNQKDDYKYYLYNPEWVDVLFPEGSLHVSLHTTASKLPFVKDLPSPNETQISPVQSCGEVEIGDIVISVNQQSTTDLTFKEFRDCITSAQRPLRIRFSRPEKDPSKHDDHPTRPGKKVEWKHDYIHLPVKLIDLTKTSIQNIDQFIQLSEDTQNGDNNSVSNTSTTSSRLSVIKSTLTPLNPNAQLLIDQVRAVSFLGIPEESNYRPFYWLYLMGCLSSDSNKWNQELSQIRDRYNEFVNTFIVDRNNKSGNPGGNQVANPLSCIWRKRKHVENEIEDSNIHNIDEERSESNINTKWTELFDDELIRENIWKDVHRTHTEFHFFDDNARDALSRILFVFAQLNKGVGYVQGMNEILAPLYYVFAHRKLNGIDSTDISDVIPHPDAESVTFELFTKILGERKDLYLPALDGTDSGLPSVLGRFRTLIEYHLPKVSALLRQQKIECELFSIRWFTTLYSREFELPDTIRLWDSIFSDPKRYEMIYFIALAILHNISGQLLVGDFISNISLLQKFDPPQIDDLVHVAMYFRDQEYIRQYLEIHPELKPTNVKDFLKDIFKN